MADRPKVSFVAATDEERPILEIGLRRVGPFLERWAAMQWTASGDPPDIPAVRMTLPQVLAAAYLQGVRDAGETLARAGWLRPEEPADG